MPAAKLLTRMSLFADELARDLLGLGMFEIQRQRFFALVVLIEISRAIEPHEFAVGPRRKLAGHARTRFGLDANDLGAEMRELQRAIRAGPYPGEIAYADSGERRLLGHQITPLRLSSASRAGVMPRRPL